MATDKSTTSPPLTPRRIESLKPQDGIYEVTDAGAPGLRLRVMPSGQRYFRWHVRVGEKQRVVTLGRWSATKEDGFLTLAEARWWLEKLKEANRRGELDATVAELEALTKRRRAPEPVITPAALTVRDLATAYMQMLSRNRKRPEYVELQLRVHVLPSLGDKAVEAVTPRDCRLCVETVVERGHRTQAARVLQTLKALFDFGLGRDELKMNPAAALSGNALGVEHNVCNRVLSDDEVPLFWRALDDATGADRPAHRKLSPTIALGLKVLLTTGVRSGELIKARWSDVDFTNTTWTVPVAHRKLTVKASRTAKDWVVPLSPLAVDLFQQLRALAGASPWVLASPVDGTEHLADKALARAMTRLQEGDAPTLSLAEPRPTPHDCRRSVRTGLGRLGVPPHICELCLGHKLPGVVGVYDVGDYLSERRKALELWGDHLTRLVAAPSNVVALAR